jgi:rhodanese-related sulfurtransferase
MSVEKQKEKLKGRYTSILWILVLAVLVGLGATLYVSRRTNVGSPSQVTKPDFPKEKKTTLGLYVTAKNAYDMWKAAPEKVKILDVRTSEEFLFVGHPAMAWNIPFALQTYEWNAAEKRFPMKRNPDFVSQVMQVAQPADTILVIDRSGNRSALAVNQLAQAGFKNVYNVIDGMEGDVIDDIESVFLGKRLKNGWKNSGVPWTYDVDPDRMLLPKTR